ncbi:hypothetical protein H072_6789 [Dactylellina haptotyla CBS 200.50]|uniref:Uncharacterized protein n=1 Tax=Dactylellina haptotyla (strain CBS 200.50) TaxID=1284197 RepID=S8A9B5_DACHA|nr:hypothetical protein H072_6789 [Dactylellina haptotyla CBS 200.50]
MNTADFENNPRRVLNHLNNSLVKLNVSWRIVFETIMRSMEEWSEAVTPNAVQELKQKAREFAAACQRPGFAQYFKDNDKRSFRSRLEHVYVMSQYQDDGKPKYGNNEPLLLLNVPHVPKKVCKARWQIAETLRRLNSLEKLIFNCCKDFRSPSEADQGTSQMNSQADVHSYANWPAYTKEYHINLTLETVLFARYAISRYRRYIQDVIIPRLAELKSICVDLEDLYRRHVPPRYQTSKYCTDGYSALV